MDEKLSRLIESINEIIVPRQIPQDAVLFKHVHFQMIAKKKYIPSASCFSYTPESAKDGLSSDWREYSTPELTLAVLSKTYKNGKKEFKDPTQFAVFIILQSFLSSLEGVDSTIHAPINNGNPCPEGTPNNPAHTVVVYKDPDDVEIRLKLQNHVLQITVDMKLVKEIANRI